MDPDISFTVLTILILIILSGFFSGSETALTAASRPKLHEQENKGDKRAKIVNKLRSNSESLISAILLGNNLVNILASSLATGVLIKMFGEAGIVYATLVMTLLILIFAEVLPKTIAINNADKMAMLVAPVIKFVVAVLSPFTMVINKIVKGTLHLCRVGTPTDIGVGMCDDELLGAIELHAKNINNQNAQHERAMLRAILKLDTMEIGEIMCPAKDVMMIDADLPASEIISIILDSPYTRIPLWRNTPENIIGVIHAKQLVSGLKEHEEDTVNNFDFDEIANPPWYVPENTHLLAQLQAFRNRREHFALVQDDETGEFAGIVTLEDILEEIVGEIEDEHDITTPGLKPHKDGSYIVNGSVTVRDINYELDWDLPDDSARTIAGLVLGNNKDAPEIGEEIVKHETQFTVLRKRRNQITQLKMKRLA